MPLLCLVGGLPGSGKTSAVAQAAALLQQRVDPQCVTVIEFDDLFHDQGGAAVPFDAATWHSCYSRFVDTTIAAVAAQDAGGIVFAVDNFYYKSMRERMWKAVRSLNTASPTRQGFAAIATCMLEAPAGLCKLRNARRVGAACVPDAVISTMATRIEYAPTHGAPHLVVRVGASDAEENDSAALLAAFVSNPTTATQCRPELPLEERARHPNAVEGGGSGAPSWRHALDIALRREAGVLMAAAAANAAAGGGGGGGGGADDASNANSLAKLGKAFSAARRVVLADAGAQREVGDGAEATEVAMMELQRAWRRLAT